MSDIGEVRSKLIRCRDERAKLRETLEWLLARHKMDNPPWQCDCDVCSTCRTALGKP